MKKFLFSTTALAVAGAFAFSGDANAAAKPIKIGVGGFMASQAGVGSNAGSFEEAGGGTSSVHRNEFNTVQDSEIYFTGSTKLDNGITVSVTVQLEGDQSNGADIDESYMKLTGGFGDIRLGSVTGPVSTLKHTAPYVGFRLDGGDTDAYITVPAAVTASNSTNAASSGDANKIVYITPVVGGGLRLGVGYTPSLTAVNTAPAVGGNAGTEVEVYEASVSYETTMGTSSVKADIAFEHTNGPAVDTQRVYRGGISVSAGGVTVGGGYRRTDDVENGESDATTSDKGMAYDLGISYAMGAHTFGIAMAHGERNTALNEDDEEDKWGIGWAYTMGAGVTTALGYYNADYTDSAAGTAANNNDGHAIIGQIKVSF